MRMKVTKEQFEISGDKLIHTPTGAEFWKGETDIVSCDWGKAGQELSSGPRYDREDVSEVAHEIFVLTRAEGIG
jgi:hypothetical protein